MSKPTLGIYESVLTESLRREIDSLGERFSAKREKLRDADVADRIARHLSQAIQLAVESYPDSIRVPKALALARSVLIHLNSEVPDAEVLGAVPAEPGEILRSIVHKKPDGSADELRAPLIPLLDTVLLTNAPGEPRVGSQILEEIESADQVDLIMAFIRRSGVNPLLDRLRRHCETGKVLRVLTTTFTKTTEAAALDDLIRIGAQVKVSYDEKTTRLHAKGWLFHRGTGFPTVYIGSSNLTHAGQDKGLEWNVRISGARNPDVVTKFKGVFESYWNNPDFENYDPVVFASRQDRNARAETAITPLDIRLEAFQERLLEQIALSRRQGFHRNLLVSATGTGKTVMAAVDYRRLAAELKRARLLFVAHREEILDQSLRTFRQCMRDGSFGELWVGGNRPRAFQHVFASIQSITSSGLQNIDPDHFEVVIVDEFHHAGAQTYQNLLSHFQPRELLGLTATPDRSDGFPILEYFDDRIAAELRLWEAIDQRRLVPFEYYGIHDQTDLRDVPWKRGRGYDVEGLSNLLTSSDVSVRHVLEQVRRRVSLESMKGLGFCVSVAHAQFMARKFNEAGIPSDAIWADTSESDRKGALKKVSSGELKCVFSVDLFNEGIDIPSVNTLLLLRPTDSSILFLQQLGRGLRRDYNKESCLVLDFVGQHRQEFRFDNRYRSLLGGSRRQLQEQIYRGFPFLPVGCHMELDRVAAQIVLDNVKQSVPSMWSHKVEELRQIVASGDLELKTYLLEADLELEDVYQGTRCWSEMREAAGLSVQPVGPYEEVLRRACGRLLHIDDLERIQVYRRILQTSEPPNFVELSVREKRLLRMLIASVCDTALEKESTLAEGAALLWAHPQVMSEILELLKVLETRVSHLNVPLTTSADVPLQVHARYTRTEILAAFGIGENARVMKWQTGVYWAKEEKSDLLAFTLDKTSGGFSPSTRYRDYAISRELIHWESQSVTREDSETGKRYQEHARMGSVVMLFARTNVDERAFWFLGPAQYVTHESEKPMAITWRLQHALPGDLFAAFAAAIA